MQFWNEMQDKYGFSDGDTLPDGAKTYRTVYIRAVNRLAEQLESAVRAVAYDRPGVHNPCLVLFYRLTDLTAYGIKDFTEPADFVAEIVPLDEAMDEAIEQAHLLDLDRFVVVSVSVTQRFESFLADLRPVNEDDPLMVTVNGQPQHLHLEGKAMLVQETRAFDGRALAADSEYRILWLDHFARLVGLAVEEGDSVAIVPADTLVVTEIPVEVRAESENCDPIPPFHFRTLDDETLDDWGVFFDYESALAALPRAANQRGEAVQLVNGYGNTVLSSDPEGEA